MKEEILAAVMFLVRFIEKSETFPRDQLENFKNNLTTLLTQRFEKHWFPDVPAKGQGYRCIRVNGVNPVDMTLEKAAVLCGLSYRDLRLPTELTVWVDPSEVCYRLGESEGSYCTLATFPTDGLVCERPRRVTSKRESLSYRQPTSPRSHPLTGAPSHSLRLKHSPGLSPARQHYSPQWRCDRQPQHYPGAPYHMSTNRYMPHHRSAYKNILSV